jgi:nucleoside diphosphate kinase
MKLTSPGKEHMEAHYADLKDKKFFPGLIDYMTSGPVCAMVWEGKNVVKEGRKMLGATMPSESACGTIRGDFWYVSTHKKEVHRLLFCVLFSFIVYDAKHNNTDMYSLFCTLYNNKNT